MSILLMGYKLLNDRDFLNIDYCAACSPRHWKQHAHAQYSIDCSSIKHLSEGTRNAP
jgi:hypothetical protein